VTREVKAAHGCPIALLKCTEPGQGQVMRCLSMYIKLILTFD
jgi:hypothetical protein